MSTLCLYFCVVHRVIAGNGIIRIGVNLSLKSMVTGLCFHFDQMLKITKPHNITDKLNEIAHQSLKTNPIICHHMTNYNIPFIHYVLFMFSCSFELKPITIFMLTFPSNVVLIVQNTELHAPLIPRKNP